MRAAGSRSDGGDRAGGGGTVQERLRGAGGVAEAAAARRTSRDIAFHGSVSARTWTGRKRATWGIQLGPFGGARAAVGGDRRREAVRCVGDYRAGAGEREGERKAAGKLPHHHVVLRGRSIDGGRQRGGGAAAARGASGRGGGGGRGC
jgi:hypothetical protein